MFSFLCTCHKFATKSCKQYESRVLYVQYQSWHIAEYVCRRSNTQHSEHASQHNYATYSQVRCNAKLRGPIPFLNPNTQSNLSDLKRSNKTNILASCSKKLKPETGTTREVGIMVQRTAGHIFCCIRHAKVASSVLQTLYNSYHYLLYLNIVCTICSVIEMYSAMPAGQLNAVSSPPQSRAPTRFDQ